MIVSSSLPLHLTYCLNVHPGESFQDQWNAARFHAGADKPFGLGMWLSAKAVQEAGLNHIAQEFGAWCRRQNLYVFTLNGFPYGNFHRVPVKAGVYHPDWTTPERRDYTLALADLLAGWLPEHVPGSISTVPCWYAPDYPDEQSRTLANFRTVEHLLSVARHLEDIALKTGRDICLGLEPEPWCFLERMDDVVRFFHEHLFPSAGPQFEKILRRRIGLCIDTCHNALAFESPVDVIRTCEREGIRIAKIQLSAALAFSENWNSVREKLLPFAEPVYFHQTSNLHNGSLTRWPDLPDAMRDLDAGAVAGETRVHFHVPLHWAGEGDLRSTRDNMTEEFWSLVFSGVCPHIEIETYTYHVLPERLATGGLYGSIKKEYEWVLEKRKTSKR
jgi:hypothetical protein